MRLSSAIPDCRRKSTPRCRWPNASASEPDRACLKCAAWFACLQWKTTGCARSGKPIERSMIRLRRLAFVALLAAANGFAAEFVQAVEFPYYHHPRPLWERELVWLKNIG